MKIFQFVFKLLNVLLCAFVVSCSEKDESIVPEPIPEPTPVEKNYELADNVIELEGDLLKHVNSLKGDTLVYNSNTPDNTLPKVGEIVIVTQSTDIFPSGFLGKVTEVFKEGEIRVVTEVAALDEAFTYLNVSQSFELTPESSNVISRNTDNQTEFKKFTTPFSKEFSDAISLNGELVVGVNVDVSLNIDKRDGKKLRNGKITVSTLQEVDMSLDVELEKEFDESLKFPPKAITFPPLQLGPITLVPALQPYLFVQAEGKIETHPTMFYQQIRTSSLAFDGNSWSFNNDNSNDPTVEFNLTPEISMQGNLYSGVGVAMEFRLYGSEDNKAFIDAKIGPQISSEVTLATDPNSLYESGKDSNLDFEMLFSAGGGAGVKFFFIEKEWSHYPINLSFLKSTHHIFPSFSNDSLTYAQGAMSVSTTLGRNLLWKQDVGLALYNGNECVQILEPLTYKFEEDFKDQNPLKGTFENIPEEKQNDYSVWSYTKWGEIYIKCKKIIPKKRILGMEIVEVSTGDLVDAFSFHYKNGVIDKIVKTEEYGEPIVYTFDYSNDDCIKVVATCSDEKDDYILILNDMGFIESCEMTNSDSEGSYSQDFEFEYNKTGQMTSMKRSEENELWEIIYKDSDAIEITCDGKKTHTISYGSEESIDHWIMHEWMYGIDIDEEMELFGLIGMLGKPSKHLPLVNIAQNGESVLKYNWFLNPHGYPERLIINEIGYDYVVDFLWE